MIEVPIWAVFVILGVAVLYVFYCRLQNEKLLLFIRNLEKVKVVVPEEKPDAPKPDPDRCAYCGRPNSECICLYW